MQAIILLTTLGEAKIHLLRNDHSSTFSCRATTGTLWDPTKAVITKRMQQCHIFLLRYVEILITSQAVRLSEGKIAQCLRMDLEYFKAKRFPDRDLEYQKDNDFLDGLKSQPQDFCLSTEAGQHFLPNSVLKYFSLLCWKHNLSSLCPLTSFYDENKRTRQALQVRVCVIPGQER